MKSKKKIKFHDRFAFVETENLYELIRNKSLLNNKC